MMMRNEKTAVVLTSELNSNLFEIKQLENPDDLMEKAIADVNEAFETLYDNFDLSYEQFYKYIQFHNDDLTKEIEELWDSVNTNIYDHYEQGVLLSFELKEWKSELIEWKEKVIAAIRDLVKEEFHDRFFPGEAQPVYVVAA
jgi:hypothetical protein